MIVEVEYMHSFYRCIFLLDQKVEPLEFLDRLKVVALEFNRLTNREREILKHWLKNTVDETISEDAVKILESSKEGVEKIVANNAFMIKEMKERVEKKGIEEGVKKQKENSRLASESLRSSLRAQTLV